LTQEKLGFCVIQVCLKLSTTNSLYRRRNKIWRAYNIY